MCVYIYIYYSIIYTYTYIGVHTRSFILSFDQYLGLRDTSLILKYKAIIKSDSIQKPELYPCISRMHEFRVWKEVGGTERQ